MSVVTQKSIATLSVLLGETLLSLYPILLKTVPVNLFTQVFTRVITTVVVSYFFLSTSIVKIITTPSYYLISILYLVHIYTSYLGFLKLNMGVALSIFYIYPLINILLKSISQDQPLNQTVINQFIISLIGVFLIAWGGESAPQSPPNLTKNPNNSDFWQLFSKEVIGVIAILGAALTEALIYTFYKAEGQSNPFDMLFTLCFGGSLILLLAAFWGSRNQQSSFHLTGVGGNVQENVQGNAQGNVQGDTRGQIGKSYVKLIAANLLMGVAGYALRFYSIPKISTEWYSVLAFCEVILAYVFGWYFLGEKISRWHLIGTSMIVYSIYQIKNLGYE